MYKDKKPLGQPSPGWDGNSNTQMRTDSSYQQTKKVFS